MTSTELHATAWPVESASPPDGSLAATERVIATRLTRILAWTGIVVFVVATPTILFITPEQSGRLLVALFAGLVGAMGLWWLRSGSILTAARFVLWGLWLTMAAAGVFNGGVSAPALIASIVLVAFSALVLGLRHGLMLCAATTALCIVLVVYERTGHAWVPVPPEYRAVLYIVLGVMTVFMLWSTSSMLRASALRAQTEAAQRAVAERQLHASQEELQAINVQLEARVAERTAQLAAANRELEAFSYSVAHDLRAPLRAIDGFSALLEADLGRVLNEDTHRDVERIRAGCRLMGEQIDGLLRLSHLSRTELHRRPTDLSVVAARVVESLRQAHPGRMVEVGIAPDLISEVDPNLIRVVLENLISNAWKYTAKTSAARIDVGRAAVNGVNAFFVRDNGAGFDMAYAHKLFVAFQRLHGVHEFEGNGIGLATVQRIINRHNGLIWAEAAVDKGATFWFTVPPAE